MVSLYVGRFIDRYPICSSILFLDKRYSGSAHFALALASKMLAWLLHDCVQYRYTYCFFVSNALGFVNARFFEANLSTSVTDEKSASACTITYLHILFLCLYV